MGDFITLATERLKNAGYRITRPRKLVLSVLAGAEGPLSPAHIHGALEGESRRPDLVTIYRVLAVFDELRIVHQTHVGQGYIGCRALDAENHHPILCTRCGAFEELDLDAIGQVMRAVEVTDWRITGHLVEFTGLCPKCRAELDG